MNNTASDLTNKQILIRDWIVLSLYLVTAVFAVFGNAFVCWVVYVKKQMRSATYILIVNMAISDIIGGIVIPGQWFFCSTWFLGFNVGDRLCGLNKSAQILSYYVSTYTMTAIAIDRYKMILYPLKPRIRPLIPIIVTWFLGALFTSTTLASMRVSEYFSPVQGIIGCKIIFPSNISFILRKMRVIMVMMTQYVVPLAITGYLYGMVMYTIWQREQVGSVSDKKKQVLDKNKKRTIKMLIVVVTLFAVAWFPTHLMHFFKFYTNIIPLSQGKCNATTYYMLCYWLGISSCCYNPFIYCYFNPDFKAEAIRLWNFFLPCCSIKPKDQQKKVDADSCVTNATSSVSDNEVSTRV